MKKNNQHERAIARSKFNIRHRLKLAWQALFGKLPEPPKEEPKQTSTNADAKAIEGAARLFDAMTKTNEGKMALGILSLVGFIAIIKKITE